MTNPAKQVKLYFHAFGLCQLICISRAPMYVKPLIKAMFIIEIRSFDTKESA